MKFKELKSIIHRSLVYRIMLVDLEKKADQNEDDYLELNVVEIAKSPDRIGPGILIYLSQKDEKQIKLQRILDSINTLIREKELMEMRINLLRQKYVESVGEFNETK